MATYNSDLYNIETGSTSASLPFNFTQASSNQDGGRSRVKSVVLDQTVTAYASGDVVNLFNLPKGSRPTGIVAFIDTASTSLTVQVGVTGTAGFFTVAATALAAINTRTELLTSSANWNTETTQDYTVILTFGGASVAAGAKVKILMAYVRD